MATKCASARPIADDRLAAVREDASVRIADDRLAAVREDASVRIADDRLAAVREDASVRSAKLGLHVPCKARTNPPRFASNETLGCFEALPLKPD